MSSANYIETHITPNTSFSNIAALGNALESLNYFDPASHAGPNYNGFVKLTPTHLGFYESAGELDEYGTRLQVYCDVSDFAAELSRNLVSGEIILLDLPEGNPASVFRITPGQIDLIVDGNKSNWSM